MSKRFFPIGCAIAFLVAGPAFAQNSETGHCGKQAEATAVSMDRNNATHTEGRPQASVD